jgi:ADP-ribose pyrophosphatase YjhB (NUDIX family)
MRRVQRVAAYALCVDADDRLLLCRLSARTQAPGWWTLPGGGVEFGEHPEMTVQRELTEETGLSGEVVELLGVDSATGVVRADAGDHDAGDYDLHRIRLLYRVRITGGTLRAEAAGSTDDARWFRASEAELAPLVPVGELGLRYAWGGAGTTPSPDGP